MAEPKPEMRSHWFTEAINDTVADPNRPNVEDIARRCGEVIADHNIIRGCIGDAITEYRRGQQADATARPSLPHLVRERIALALESSYAAGYD